MNLHSDVLRLIPWLANYKNSEQGRKPQGFSEWLKQKLEEFRDFVVGMFAWLAAALEDLKEMLEEVLDAIMLNLLEWLLYLIWLMIRAALLVIIYISFALDLEMFLMLLVCIVPIFVLLSITYNLQLIIQDNSISLLDEVPIYTIEFNIGFFYYDLFDLIIPSIFIVYKTTQKSFSYPFNFICMLEAVPISYLSELFSETNPSSNLSSNAMHPISGLSSSSSNEEDMISGASLYWDIAMFVFPFIVAFMKGESSYAKFGGVMATVAFLISIFTLIIDFQKELPNPKSFLDGFLLQKKRLKFFMRM